MSKPPLRASEQSFQQQTRSPLDNARHEFLAEAMEKDIHNNRPKGAKPRKVEQRENVILKPPNNTQNLPRQSFGGQEIYRSFD